VDINNKAQKPPIRIVIIDSGIDTRKSNLSKFVKESIGFQVNTDGCIVEDMSMKARHQHGTVISMVIRHICKDVEFISMNILDEELATDGRILIHALKKAISYKPDIINLSLGTTKQEYKEVLEDITNEAEENNIIIVAATNNRGYTSYPACIKGVVGVKGAKTDSIAKFGYMNGFFYAPVGATCIEGIDEIDGAECIKGTSMAAAYITGHLALIKHLKDIQESKDVIDYMKDLILKS